jgi:hypothetical protein
VSARIPAVKVQSNMNGRILNHYADTPDRQATRSFDFSTNATKLRYIRSRYLSDLREHFGRESRRTAETQFDLKQKGVELSHLFEQRVNSYNKPQIASIERQSV